MTSVASPRSDLPVRSADDGLTERWRFAVQRTAGLPFVARAADVAACDVVAAATAPGRTLGEHIHLANAYSVALADEQPELTDVFDDRRSWLLPDGRPLVWLSALRRHEPRLKQVRGPQFMLDVADLGRAAKLRHYLLGGSPEVLRALEQNLRRRFPGIEIVGTFSPPFRAPTPPELAQRDAAIQASGAQIVWVGLGTPKQDHEAARLARSLPVVAVAVGAAFDYAAGVRRPAPHWVSVAGFEWLWRFAAEPRRLWKRYTVGNARFLRVVSRAERRHADRAAVVAAPRTTVVGQLPPPMHGSAVMTERLIAALQRNGERVAVVDRRFSRSVTEVGRPSLRKVFAVPSLVARYAEAVRQSDRTVMLITTTPMSFAIDQALLRLTRDPVVLYVHTVGFQALAARGPRWDRMVRRVFGSAARVVVLGESLVGDVLPFVGHDRIEVVPNAALEPALRSTGSGYRVLFLSNLLPGKGADVFARVARDLQHRRPDLPWRFDLAGAGNAAALGPLPAAVTVHGPVRGDAKAALLAEADVLLVPSTYAMEAQPLVIVEALSCGLPVVAYDNGGIRDLVDETVGALVQPGDEGAMADAVLELLGSDERRAAARAAARTRYEVRHSVHAYADAWRRVLLRPAAGESLR